MKIDTLDDLEQLLDLCHRQAVHAIEVDGIRLNLTPTGPTPATQAADGPDDGDAFFEGH